MTAPAYQPVPTAHQQLELERLLASDRAKRHGVRQYADNQPKQALISPVEAAGVACCDVTDEAVMELSLPVFLGRCIAALGTWAAAGYAAWWLVGLFFGEHA
jgi:hypothetical protein